METRRWTNPHQPQTLQIAVILLYINAVFIGLFSLLGGTGPVGLVLLAGGVAGGWGVANERKWGYLVALGAAALPLVLRLVYGFAGDAISLLFEIALVALLLHPQSRDYRRIWFS